MLEFNCQSLSLLVSAFPSAKGMYIDLLPTGGGGGGVRETFFIKKQRDKILLSVGAKNSDGTSCITVYKML